MISCENCRHMSGRTDKCRKGGEPKEGTICGGFEPFPAKRDLDGVYFRVKRDGKWGNVCFSDMTHEEREELLAGRTTEWWKSLAGIMAGCLRNIGDEFGIIGGSDND